MLGSKRINITRNRSLKTILATSFFTLTLAALVITSGLLMYFNFRAQESAISNNQKLIAQGAAQSVSSYVKEKLAVLQNTVSMLSPETFNKAQLNELSQSILGANPSLVKLILTDSKDSIVSRISRRSLLYPSRYEIIYRIEAQSKIRNNNFILSPIYIDEITNEPLVLMAVPIKDVFGKFHGSLIAELNLKFMWDLVDNLKIGKTGYVYVVDRNGSLIAYGDAARVLKNENVKSIKPVSTFINSKTRQTDISTFDGINQKRVVGTYVPLGTPDWAVITELPWPEAYEGIIVELILTIFILFGMALLISIVGLFLANRLSIPVISLMNTASRITSGQKDLQAVIEGPKEVASLAEAFNSMTSRLNKSYQELEEQITEVKLAEERLRISQFSIDKSLDAIFWLNKYGKNIYVNEEACRSLGYEKEELLELYLWDYDPHYPRERWTEEWDSYQINRKGGGVKLETIHKRKDGTTFNVEVSSTHTWFGDYELHIAHVRDISDRKKAEFELTKTQNYVTNIINSMPSLLIGIDIDNNVTLWNHNTEIETGICADDAVGKHLLDIYPQLFPRMESINKAINQKTIQRELNVQRNIRDQIHFEDITIYPLIANGIEGAVIRIDDKTEQKRLEEMMIQSEKMLSVGGLAAGMAHEINNPLAGILQSAEILKRRLTDTELEANKKIAVETGLDFSILNNYLTKRGLYELMENIRQSGSRAAEIVKNMLSFARKSDQSFSVYDIAKLLDETVVLAQTDYNLKKNYDFKQIKIIKEYDPDLPLIQCEGSKIQQVFLNLLKNGAEAMGEHGTYDGSPKQFILRLINSDKYLNIEIRDNGPGMDEATRKRVFAPFFTTKHVGLGTGLGLSVSYFIIVENHGCLMSVESEPNKGTKFIIKLKK